MRTKTPTEQARWRRSQIAETFASVCVSAPSYRFAEYIGFLPVVKSELKLRQIERQIFFADMMVRAEDSAFQERPERFHIVRVNHAAHVLALAMVHGFMRKPLPSGEILIAGMFIGRDQRDFFFVHYLVDEPMESRHIGVLDHLADYVSLARDRADHGNFSAGSANVLFLVVMAVFIEAAHVSFVHFDNTHELAEVRVFHSGSEPHAHIPRGLVRAGAKHPMDLERANSLLARDHQVQNLEPHEQRLFGFLKDRSGSQRETIGRAWLRSALHTLPMPGTRLARVHLGIVASWAVHATGKAANEQIRSTGSLIGEQPLEIADRHLPNESGLYRFGSEHDAEISKSDAVSQEPANRLTLRERRPTA